MPTAEENREMWSRYDWSRAGEEWTVGFGGPEMAWQFCIEPRIGTLLPTGHLLEIGPGYGVWTAYLRPLARRMTLVDVTPGCIKACRRRFGKRDMSYAVNDGRSLDMVDDGSVDLAFSFNSLVHADRDAVRSYILQLGRKLRPGGLAFLHHSNLAEFRAEIPHLPPDKVGNRGEDVSAALVREDCQEAGLACYVQELFPWRLPRLLDCISLLGRGEEPFREPLIFENWRFFQPAQHVVRVRARYHPPGREALDWLSRAAAGSGWASEQVQRNRNFILNEAEEGVRIRSRSGADHTARSLASG